MPPTTLLSALSRNTSPDLLHRPLLSTTISPRLHCLHSLRLCHSRNFSGQVPSKPAFPGLVSASIQATGSTGSHARHSRYLKSKSFPASGENPTYLRSDFGSLRTSCQASILTARKCPCSVQHRRISRPDDQSRLPSRENSRDPFPNYHFRHHREPPKLLSPCVSPRGVHYLSSPIRLIRRPFTGAIPHSDRSWIRRYTCYSSRKTPKSTLAENPEVAPAMANPKPVEIHIKGPNVPISNPVDRTHSPGPLAADFARQQIYKQNKNNFHSSSLKRTSSYQSVSRMNTVNRTALHPHGVQYVVVIPPCEQD